MDGKINKGDEQNLDGGLKTSICDGIVTTSSFGNENDRELVAKVTDVLIEEGVSIGKAMAVLDTARTAIIKRTLETILR